MFKRLTITIFLFRALRIQLLTALAVILILLSVFFMAVGEVMQSMGM